MGLGEPCLLGVLGSKALPFDFGSSQLKHFPKLQTLIKKKKKEAAPVKPEWRLRAVAEKSRALQPWGLAL